MLYVENEGLRGGCLTELDGRPIKVSHALVTVGARTQRGGEVVKPVASRIVSGAGFAATYQRKPIASIPGLLQPGHAVPAHGWQA